jgi:hypothetical protein
MSFKNPRRKNPKESNLKNEGAREGAPIFLSNNQESPCPDITFQERLGA